jgi:hypothetical protein
MMHLVAMLTAGAGEGPVVRAGTCTSSEPSSMCLPQVGEQREGWTRATDDCSNSRTELTNQPSLPLTRQLPPDHQEMPDKKIEEKKAIIAEVSHVPTPRRRSEWRGSA